MRPRTLLLCTLLAASLPAAAQVSVGIGVAVPGVSIGINLGHYPQFVAVPGYPVYYAPQASVNVFFYDGLYWVLADDDWYASTWYDGPWHRVSPYAVPPYVLRVPVRYYPRPPKYFHGWRNDAPPRWDQHWGPQWQQRRSDWDRPSTPAPPRAPLPTYQQQYAGDRYPPPERQQELHQYNYRYEPHDPVVREQFHQPPGQDKNKGNGQGQGQGGKSEGKGKDKGKDKG
jgi:hypothetical protein